MYGQCYVFETGERILIIRRKEISNWEADENQNVLKRLIIYPECAIMEHLDRLSVVWFLHIYDFRVFA